MIIFICSVCNAQDLLVGYTYNDSGFYPFAPSSENVWKSFQVRAIYTGRVESITIYVGGLTSGNPGDPVSNCDIGWALYEDNNNEVGDLKISGYVESYNFSNIGEHEFYITNNINNIVIADTYYWITWYTTAWRNVLIGRGRVSGCDTPTRKKGTSQGWWSVVVSPPPSPYWNVTYGDGCYSWGCWGEEDESLPVGLTYFKAVPRDRQITLYWSTNSEINNLGFTLKRSQGDDIYKTMVSYKTDLNLQGAGNSSDKNDYKYTDNTVNYIEYWYKLISTDFNGEEVEHEPVLAMSVNTQCKLYQNFPNPFNIGTIIKFDIPNTSTVSLCVYDLLGQKVATIVDRSLMRGLHEFLWDAHNISSGIYLYVLRSENFMQYKIALLIR